MWRGLCENIGFELWRKWKWERKATVDELVLDVEGNERISRELETWLRSWKLGIEFQRSLTLIRWFAKVETLTRQCSIESFKSSSSSPWLQLSLNLETTVPTSIPLQQPFTPYKANRLQRKPCQNRPAIKFARNFRILQLDTIFSPLSLKRAFRMTYFTLTLNISQ